MGKNPMGAWRREQSSIPREEWKGFSEDIRFELVLEGKAEFANTEDPPDYILHEDRNCLVRI